jgi:protein-histidine pros-kinase
MNKPSRRWLADTLARRLFLLMWAALIASHLVGYATVKALVTVAGHELDENAQMAPLPSLPPTPGVPEVRGAMRSAEGSGPEVPTDILLVDYGVRILVIALAAAWGSRWLSAPVRELAAASRSLNEHLADSAEPVELDEHSGTREVREASHVFNLMARRLRQQFRARGLMVAAISHDLRTPLTRLRMRIDAMGGDPNLAQRSVDDIQEMNRLIDTALEVFRGDTLGPLEPPQELAIGALVQSLVDDRAEQGEPVEVLAAAGDAMQARVRAQPDALRIDPAQLEAVFEPFYRVEASRNRNTGGAGLGLYIARELAHRQGASITLANRPGGGLRAELVVPRA